MNPYILPPQQMQDVSGLQPVFQNFGQQQANQQAALAQQGQLAQQAGQMQSSGINPLALAQALRKDPNKKPAPVYDKSEMMPDTPQYADSAYAQAGY
jgi:DNA-binding protein H-NS